jgi:hypothetical protein
MVARFLCFGTSRHAKRAFLTQGYETSRTPQWMPLHKPCAKTLICKNRPV